MKHILSLAGLFLTMVLTANAQIAYPPLKVGDKVPDIVFRNMSNYPTDSARISDFRGKLLILDFWSINCNPCIAGMPKMEKLQQKFGNKIQILLVNGLNPLEQLGGKKDFPRRSSNSIVRGIRLPFVFQSLTQKECEIYKYGKEDLGPLTSLFQHNGEPFHAWVDQRGVVVALTTGSNTNEKSIGDFLARGKIQLETAHYYSAFYHKTDGSFLRPPNELVLSKLQYSSVITKNIFTKYNYGAGWIRDSVSNSIIGYRINNEWVRRLFIFAYDFREDVSGEQVIFDSKHVLPAFIQPTISMAPEEEAKWAANNRYCYELMLPPSRISESDETNMATVRKKMRHDLEHYFGIVGSIEQRKRKCLVFVRTNKQIALGTKGGIRSIERLPGEYKIVNTPFVGLINDVRIQVNSSTSGVPVIDETGLGNTLVDLTIKADRSDIAAVRRELNSYGVDIKEEVREFKMLVLRPANDLPANRSVENAKRKSK